MELPPQAQQDVAARLAASEKERKKTRQYVESGQLLKADTPERIEQRKAELLASQNLTSVLGAENQTAMARGTIQTAPEAVQHAFERTFGSFDTQPCWFLTRGAELRRSIGRIYIRDRQRRVGWGTGFLVAPNLLLTNQHVLDSQETARFSRVEFDYEETFSGDMLSSAVFDFEPDTFFVSSPARGGLDYALVAVAERPRPESGRPTANLAEFGYNILLGQEGKLLKGELIHCIHHPEGQPRQVTLRENRLMAIQDPALDGVWMHYETDTEPGSSGAPLYNNQWQIVGIHHAGVEKRDNEGNILAIGGARWTPEMGERQKWWYANEGLRISRFLAHVEAQVNAEPGAEAAQGGDRIVSEAGRALFTAMLKLSQQRSTPPPPVVPDRVTPAPTPHRRFNPE